MRTFYLEELINGVNLYLDKGEYFVNIVGGWYIKTNAFRIVLEPHDKLEPIYVKEIAFKMNWRNINWKVTELKKVLINREKICLHISEFGKFKIRFSGNYLIKINNENQLVVYYSRLLPKRIFSSPIALSDIQIQILQVN